MTLVCCLDCSDFTIDPIGFGAGIGKCASYEAGMASKPSEKGIRQARMIRGNRPEYDLFYGNTGKMDCKRFLPKEKPANSGKEGAGFNEIQSTGNIVND